MTAVGGEKKEEQWKRKKKRREFVRKRENREKKLTSPRLRKQRTHAQKPQRALQEAETRRNARDALSESIEKTAKSDDAHRCTKPSTSTFTTRSARPQKTKSKNPSASLPGRLEGRRLGQEARLCAQAGLRCVSRGDCQRGRRARAARDRKKRAAAAEWGREQAKTRFFTSRRPTCKDFLFFSSKLRWNELTASR